MSIKLLTSIDNVYYSFIENEAKKNKTTKKSVVENIINYYIQEQKKKNIQKEYTKMWKDEEYLNEMVDNSNYLSYL